jgi:DNA-binding NtrC family response regulator
MGEWRPVWSLAVNRLRIAVLDDEREILDSLSHLLRGRGYSVSCFSGPDRLFKAMAAEPPHVLFLDIALGEGSVNGIQVLKRLWESHPAVHVIVISGTSDIRTAVEAIKLGARDFIEKPLAAGPILDSLGQIEARAEAEEERRALLDQVLEGYRIVGESPALDRVREAILRYADANEPVLITGESGTGKELVAANLHFLSRRRSERFSRINVASISDTLVEDALFGHEKGAFSGADRAREGILSSAGSSTLFLDEIGELKTELQPKLLRAIQEREIVPLGSNDPVRVEARLVFATNRDLKARMEEGTFRSDLYYRISTLTIEVPPLRCHAEDVPLLARAFVREYCAENNIRFKELSREALEKLMEYRFPGNVRELKNLLIRSILAAPDREVITDLEIVLDPQAPLRAPELTLPLDLKKREMEKAYIEAQLAKFGGDVKATAASLGIIVNNLYRKMKALGIKPPR